jgi:hypothetical protein
MRETNEKQMPSEASLTERACPDQGSMPTGCDGAVREKRCRRCGETPSEAEARWARIVMTPHFDAEGAPTPCDHLPLRRPARASRTEGGRP